MPELHEGAAGPGVVPPARTALVTGASGGIGRILSVALAEAGLAVGLLGRDAGRLEATRAAVAAAGAPVAVAVADVTDAGQVAAAVSAVEERIGGVDLLVNNAGVIEQEEVPVWEADPEEWWHVVSTTLRASFLLARAVVPGMLERGGGRVVDLSSGAGAQDREIHTGYCTGKAGLFRIAGGIHLAGFDRGLRSFEMSPGVVRTAMSEGMSQHRGRMEWTPGEAVAELLLSIARGELDAFSGGFVRAGVDTPQALRAAASAGLPEGARRLLVRPYGPSDPLG
ncbi:NADP-dependent 3-hydroxy acid dehydrogenase YdfG [Kineococcus xinjiangensis]|uniref:NADP-dependent 3-hydroxy acid dehydrogenase YdfG n=1 Tax=Kineococcus xinjiangensis TaxID=512762 RepID=A0A2S6IM17_9ACTN|nr:SDR family oxidoreductase [Kineococcus xinjiangensis]PPK95190.1 NADP-dependent 3-hydroxy acid dehydrogenase YdfG [Kineococcus xinjiangensis]